MLRTNFGVFAFVIVLLFSANSVYSQVVIASIPQEVGIGPNESIVLSAGDLFDVLGDLPTVDGLDLVFNISGFLQDPGFIPPPVVNISGLGIFGEGAAVFTPASLSAGSAANASLSIPTSAALIEGAPVAEVFLDTTGLAPGIVFFEFDDQTANTTFLNAGVPVDTASFLTNGFRVSVPEPSVAVFLVGLGAAVLVRRIRA